MLRHAVRRTTRAVYQNISKPILFLQHPDVVHRRLMRMAKTVQRIPGLRDAPMLWSHRSRRLEQEVAGITFKNPIGLSAGFDKNIKIPRMIQNIGFGFMIGGSITAQPCAGNPKPWFYRLPKSKSLVVHAGLPNDGAQAIVERLKRQSTRQFDDFPLSVSVAKTNTPECATDEQAIADYCQSLALLEKHAVCQLYEINISCPNTFGGEPFTTPARLESLLSAVDALRLSKPLFVKMPISIPWREFRELLEIVVTHNVQGVTIGNLLKGRARANLSEDLPVSVMGGLSGAPTRDISTELIRRTYETHGDRLVIIGVGGVFSASDAYEKIKAGASLVGLITGLIFEGPQLVGEINVGLEKLLKKDGHASIADAVGSDVTQKRV